MADFLPLELDDFDRALLGAIYLCGREGRLLHPVENRGGYKLESQGLVRLELERFAVAVFGYYVSKAWITPAGCRCVEGPRLVRLDGAPWPPAESAAHDSIVAAIRAANPGQTLFDERTT